MIDWDQPIVRQDTGARVWVWGKQEYEGFRTPLVIVQDRHGSRLPFQACGTPMGHYAYIANDTSAGLVVRTRLAQLIMARARDLVDLEALAEDMTVEAIDTWAAW